MTETALVTGAARRIGRALALEAARAGYAVAIHHRHPDEDVASLINEIEADGGTAMAVEAELSDRTAVAGLIDRAGALGPVTLLVNNASLFQVDRFEDLDVHFDEHFEVNFRAPLFLSQAFAAALPAGEDGLIVNILDQRVWRPTPQFFSYSLSKAALWNATRSMAQALAPRIRVNGIGPGPTLASIHQSDAEFAAEVAGVLLQQSVAPEDIAAALRYLIGARNVTGQMIAVDAGQHLAWKTPDISGD